ncbi:MAG: ABC-F family ATP-binding cassette domain-containing protein [Leptospiraceae bacterium]|nr:ABC-F family ATP-binding cassette domain-containing protein [Leptospiraceae bacterium]
MNVLSAQNLAKTHGDQQLFKDFTFGLNSGEKVGIIGRNGQGKSTLARVLAGIDEPDQGNVVHSRNLRIAFMEQNPHPDPTITIDQYIRTDASGDLPAGQIREVLSLVGIESPDKNLSQLSGGGLRRASLARALLQEADILFLDEPTNHLDLDAILSLEERLRKFSGALVLITHDRYFLDRLVSSILEVDGGQVLRFEGGYSSYLEKKADLEQRARIAEHKAKRYLSTELEWLRRQPKARGTKQQARIDRIESVQNRDRYREKKELNFKSKSTRLGNKILEIHGLAGGVGEARLFHDFDYRFQDADRIGIIGPNGCGKSTFLDIVANRRNPQDGRVEYGETLRIGYFDQMGRDLEPDMRVEDLFKKEVGPHAMGTGLSPKELLEAFLFHSSVLYRPLGKLSGGEKRRILLVLVLLKSPNFLILDEPTNDFDIATLTALEAYLDDFPGPVVTVSHDRWFLDRIASHLFLFQPDGTIRDYTGSASDYLVDRETEGSGQKPGPKKQESQSTAGPEQATRATGETSTVSDGSDLPPRLGNKERKELAELPVKIEKLEQEIASLEEKLASGDADAEKVTAWGSRHVEASRELEVAMERWLELEEMQRQIRAMR